MITTRQLREFVFRQLADGAVFAIIVRDGFITFAV
jgi:hypothetical protein